MPIGKIGPPANTEFPELPELTPIEVEIEEISAYEDTKFPNDDGTPKRRLQVVLAATDPQYEGGKVWVFTSPSWHTKGQLRKLAQATFPTEVSDETLYDTDVDSLVGKKLVIIGQYGEDSTYLKVSSFRRVGAATRGAAKPVAAAVAEDDGIPF